MTDCIFCKIIAGEIPASTVYEDDDVLVFDDIRPAAPVHMLIVPKRHIVSLAHITGDDTALLGKMLALAPRLAAERGLTHGFKTSINTGKGGGQEVFHLHIHVYGTPA
jgi:histidine triad (HIT) family protein